MRHLCLTAITVVALAALSSPSALADNAEVGALVKEAAELASDGHYKSAAEKYLDAKFYADDIMLKANALKNAAKYFHKAGYYHKEFECLEEILTSFPDYIDFKKAVDREFALANAFYAGHRDPAFVWLPWIKADSQAIPIYEKALKRGPFSEDAQQARLRLGRLYIQNNQVEKGLEELRQTIAMYPGAEAQKFAYLELANALVQLSRQGDGDGKHSKEGQEVLRAFIQKYPDASEIPWAKQSLEDLRIITAGRLHNLGKYYARNKNEEAAQRYLSEVLTDYYDTPVAYESEELLASIDKEYEPTGKKYERKRFIKYKVKELPKEPEKILVVPENSGGKWLLPVQDLGVKENKDDEFDLEKQLKHLFEKKDSNIDG